MINKLIFLNHGGSTLTRRTSFDSSPLSTGGIVIFVILIAVVIISWFYFTKKKKY